MSNNHIQIYHFNNQQVCIDAYFKKATVRKIRTVQQHSRNVSSGVEISYLKTINVLTNKAKQESIKK
ncbi:hypothetical protein [Snodgrassella communis]|uniref:Uncharacterized protein n=1 Tax=Snodgrassella alvi TaxID=1196083 RepID=A0A2N9XT08_9NEIS|nr:hypothetical protein [Snodgrassella communis]PIT52018.1 hypothetical protein BHC48_02740 [Snodgrassella communis]